MPARRPPSKLAVARLQRALTIKQLREKTGISQPQYWRLENLRLREPSTRLYANCALALGVELIDLIDNELIEWYPYDRSNAHEPPEPGWWEQYAERGRSIGWVQPPGRRHCRGSRYARRVSRTSRSSTAAG